METLIKIRTFFGGYNRTKLFEDIFSKSSLSTYKSLNFWHSTQKYLMNISGFKGSRLKFLARTNCLPINAVLHRMKIRADGQCNMCQGHHEEDIEHVLLKCKAYDNHRSELYMKITEICQNCNLEFDFTGLSDYEQIQFLLGDYSNNFETRALELIDDHFKEFLIKVFYLKSQVNG